MLRSFKLCLFGAAISLFLALGAWVCDRNSAIDEIGSKDLDVDFLVTDADSGQPIHNAEIMIRSEGGLYDGSEEDSKRPFKLRTDANGKFRRVCRNNIWTWFHSRWRFTDVYCVFLPNWFLEVSAAGYETSGVVNLHDDYDGKTERAAPARDRLLVSVPLRKARQ